MADDNYNRYISKDLSQLLILSTLNKYESQQLSGYKIIQKIKNDTNTMITLRPGTIYPYLESLENDNFISQEIVNDDSAKIKGKIRQTTLYFINSNGKKKLSQLWSEWEEFERIIQKFK